MGFVNYIKGVINKMFKSDIEKTFSVNGTISDSMLNAIAQWDNIYRGVPSWCADGIKTIKMAKSVCEETSRLTNLAIGISFDGKRAEYMQQWSDAAVLPKLRTWVEYGCAFGSLILKPNGNGIDCLFPNSFLITSMDGNGNITGIVFQDNYVEGNAVKRYYTKLERHELVSDGETTQYVITNKTFVSYSVGTIGKQVNIDYTHWAGLEPEIAIEKNNGEKLDGMLFGLFTMPIANDIEYNSPLGMSIFSNAVEELKDLDVAYTRNAGEIFDSQRMVFIDDRLSSLPAKKDKNGNVVRPRIKLPKFVRNVSAEAKTDFYQEVNPDLNTAERIEGINNQLSFVGFKCGYSNGYFVLDQKTGMVTATQVEADDRRTIQLIKDVRDQLKTCLNSLFYAQSVFADLYGYAPVGDFEVNYDFGDITYNYEEDKARWYSYVTAGKVPFWRYLVKFEGYSEEEAKEIEAETKSLDTGLFAPE